MAKLPAPELTPDDPIAVAGLALLRHYGESFRQLDDQTVAAASAKTVKQWRVNARRMRSVLHWASPYLRKRYERPLDKGLRTLATLAGESRDTHLALEAIQAYADSCDEDGRRALEPLIEHWHTEHQQAHQQLQDYCDSDTFADWRTHLSDFFDAQPQEVARVLKVGEPSHLRHVTTAWIWDHAMAVRAFDVLNAPTLPHPEQVHELRIAIKRLRYLLEAFMVALPEQEAEWAHRVIRCCQAAQDAYGALNDAHTTEKRIEAFLADDRRGSRRIPLKGIRVYAAEQHRLVEEQLAEWRNYLDPLIKLM